MTISPQDKQALAIAFITGQASPDQEAQFRELFAEDSSFRKEVRDIELWLAPLHEESENVAPPADLLENIMADIEALEGPQSPVLSSQTDNPVAVNDNKTVFWKRLAIASSVIAALSIGSHLVNYGPETEETKLEATTKDQTPSLLAVLQDDSQPELVAIIYNPKTQEVVARLNNVSLPEEGDFELWLIPEGQSTPVSLGVLQSDAAVKEMKLKINQNVVSENATLAISLEALGGSTSGQPQGPILYTGAVTSL